MQDRREEVLAVGSAEAADHGCLALEALVECWLGMKTPPLRLTNVSWSCCQIDASDCKTCNSAFEKGNFDDDLVSSIALFRNSSSVSVRKKRTDASVYLGLSFNIFEVKLRAYFANSHQRAIRHLPDVCGVGLVSSTSTQPATAQVVTHTLNLA